jgi:hypothetical protein
MKLSSLSYGNPKKIGRENRKANELGLQEMAAILSPHGLYGGNRKSKIHLLNNKGYKPLNGGFGSLQIFYIGRMPGDRTLLSLDTSHAIPTRVLRFEVSRLRRPTPVRPVLLTGQTGTHRSDRSGAATAPSLVLQSWLCGSTKELCGFLVNH